MFVFSMVAGFFFIDFLIRQQCMLCFQYCFFFLKFSFQFAFFCFLSVLPACILVDIAMFIISVLP